VIIADLAFMMVALDNLPQPQPAFVEGTPSVNYCALCIFWTKEKRGVCGGGSFAQTKTRPECAIESKVERLMTLSTSAGGLLRERLAQVVEQSGVLDGDNRLGGEILEPMLCLIKLAP
jgi:hypothetical protein